MCSEHIRTITCTDTHIFRWSERQIRVGQECETYSEHSHSLTLTQAHAICNGYGIYSRLKMPFAIVCIASMRRVSIHISVRESPKDSHHFIFGLNYIRTDTLTRIKYAIRILLYILLCVRYEARSSSVGVFRLLCIFNVVSVALLFIVANM